MPGLLDDLYEPYQAALLREKYKGDKLNQSLLAPFEHMDYAMEVASEAPILAAPMAVAIPAYQATKAVVNDAPTMGLLGNMPFMRLLDVYNKSTMGDQPQTPADLDQMWAAYRGLGRGLLGR